MKKYERAVLEMLAHEGARIVYVPRSRYGLNRAFVMDHRIGGVIIPHEGTIDALVEQGYIAEGATGTFTITDAGRAVLAHKEA